MAQRRVGKQALIRVYVYYERVERLLSFVPILEYERNDDLPVARVFTPKLLLVLAMFLHGPLYHRNHAHYEEYNTWSNEPSAHAYRRWEQRFLTGPATRHDGESDPTKELEEVVRK